MFRRLFQLPPPEERFGRNFFTAGLFLNGYDPLSAEAVLLLRSILFGNILNFVLMVLMALTVWHSDFIGFKYNYPFLVFLPLILLITVHLFISAQVSLCQHQWDFVTFQKRSLKNIKKWSARGYSSTRVATYMLIATVGVALLMVLFPYAIDAFLSYSFVTAKFWFVMFDSWLGLIVSYAVVFLLFAGPAAFGLINFIQLVSKRHPFQKAFK